MTNQTTETRSMIAVVNEIYADKTGRCTISIRGMANLMDVTRQAVQQRLDLMGWYTNASSELVTPSQSLEGQGLKGRKQKRDFGEDCPVDDATFFKLIFWYAVESPRNRTQASKDLLQLIGSIGVRGWMQAEAGHDGSVQELVQSVKIERLYFVEEVEKEVLLRMRAMDQARSIEIARIERHAEERIQLHISESTRHALQYQDIQLEKLYRENLALKATIEQKYSIVIRKEAKANLNGSPEEQAMWLKENPSPAPYGYRR